MLARHAEDLFWTGRYLERAEDTARLLDVTYHGLLEGGASEAGMAWQEVLDALQLSYLFRARHRGVTAEAVEAFLVLDQTHASSIAAAITRARENARNVREHLSTELWDALNSTWRRTRTSSTGACARAASWSPARRPRPCRGSTPGGFSCSGAWSSAPR